ncbi:MAG: S41 family peptidase [Anaerolineales bacterium]
MRPVWLLLVALLLVACGSTADIDAPTEVPQRVQNELRPLQLAVLEEIRQAVADNFVYADFGGTDWEAEVSLARHRVEAGVTEEEFAGAVDDMVAALPDGSAGFMTRAERVQAEFQSGTLYEGIGAFVSFRAEPLPRVLLLSVIAGSPAEEAGLRAHDAVYKVDGFPVTEEEGLSIIERVRGPAGTEVLLEVASPSEEAREVMVRRDRVTATDTLKGDLLSPGIIYVLVPVAVDNTLAERVAGLLQVSETENEPALGLILDLRIAGSGSSWPLTEMLTLLGDGSMGQFATRAGEQPIVIPGVDVGNSQRIPLAILVGPDTSGAPEIFAGALQGTGRAPLVGLPTNGNVLSFRQLTLSDGSVLTFADSSYITPSGSDLSLTGLTPNLLVQSDWDEVTPESDPVLQSAIDLLLRG